MRSIGVKNHFPIYYTYEYGMYQHFSFNYKNFALLSGSILTPEGIITSVTDPGCYVNPGSQIPDPRSRIWIRMKILSIFHTQNYYISIGNMIQNVHPGSGS